MLAHVYLKKGAVVPMHSHDNEQLTYVVDGALKFRIGNGGPDALIVRSGEILHLPSNVPHEAEALEDTLDVDVFTPPRQDWLDGTDAYLRGGNPGASGSSDDSAGSGPQATGATSPAPRAGE